MRTLSNRIAGSILAWLTVLTLVVAVGRIHADSIGVVTARTELPANETLDWSGFGSLGTEIPDPASLATASGLIVTVSQPEYEFGLALEGLPGNQNGWWKGDFLPGQYLLANTNSPFALTLSFSQPIFGAGVQIDPGLEGGQLPEGFTAYVTAYDGATVLGQFSTTGTRTLNEDGSAPFLGVVSDTADITSLTYRVVVQFNGSTGSDYAMNFLSLETSAPVSEPSGILLAASGLALLATKSLTRRPEIQKTFRRVPPGI